MAKGERYFSIDVEASGPIPGIWWMPSFGVCPTDDLNDGFRALLKPLDYCYPEMVRANRLDVPGAMRVVAQGTSGFTWNDDKLENHNCDDLYDHYVKVGETPKAAFDRFKSWLAKRTSKGGLRPYVVGSPLSFDFMWLYWYYQYVMGEMPSFGFSGLDMRSYFMGMHGESALKTNKRRYKKLYPTDIPHDHDPLHDAQEQGDIWRQMIADRKYKHLAENDI